MILDLFWSNLIPKEKKPLEELPLEKNDEDYSEDDSENATNQ